MPSLGGRTLACGLFACAALVVHASDAAGGLAAGGPGASVLRHLLVNQVAPPPAAGAVTYTPVRRPGSSTPPSPVSPAVPVAPAKQSPAPVAPAYVAPLPAAPIYTAPAPVAPTYPAPSPVAVVAAQPVSGASFWTNQPYSPALLQGSPAPPGLPLPRGETGESGATVFSKALRPVKSVHRVFGLASDIGMPEGLNLGLVLSPADWLRLGASFGTNSASLNYRGGLSLVPMGWGPSFTLEAGHCNTAPTTSLVRTFFTVPSWVQPYVQQLGYTYVNAHVGFDYRWGGLTLFVHGGYTYLMGTIRSPTPVVVDSKTNTSIQITQDGNVTAYTLSAKAGVVYTFGRP